MAQRGHALSMGNCVFICGDDDFLVSRQGKAAFDEAAETCEDEFSLETIDGLALNVSEVETIVGRTIQAVQTVSLFGGRKAIWVKNLNFLSDSKTGRAEGSKAELEKLIKTIEGVNPADVSLIISAYPVDRRRREFKWFQKNSDFHDLRGDESSAGQVIRQECERLGTSIDNAAVSALVARVGGNTRLMIEESRKLSTYVGKGGEIEEHLITELVPRFGEGDFFETTEAFFSLDLKWTLDALRRHFFVHSEARPIIASFQNRNRLLIQLRALVDGGEITIGPRGIPKPAFEQAERAYRKHFDGLNTKTSFNVFTQNLWYLGNKVGPAVQKLNLKQLIRFQQAFLTAFEACISRPKEHHAVLNELAVKCLGK